MVGTRVLSVAAALATAGATASSALAGAANYSCQFGDLRIVGDIHRNTSLLQEAPEGTVTRLTITSYYSGGGGFRAARKGERVDVKLVRGGTGEELSNARSTLVWQRPGAPSRRVIGVCTAISGAFIAGRLATPDAVVRAAANDRAAAVSSPALPFVWSELHPDVSRAWVKVSIVQADGRRLRGFVRSADVAWLPARR
jgi:hypothetical protein